MVIRATARIGALAILISATASPVLGHSAVPSSKAYTYAVTAFQEEGDPNSLITRSATALTTVGVDGVNISANGAKVGAPDSIARRSLRVAHADHLRAELLIGNWSNAINDFSEAHAHHLLASHANIAAVAAAMAHSVKVQGWDGVSVDLESLRPRDRAGLVAFLAALRSDLPSSRSVSVCISLETSRASYQADGYDLSGIVKRVSRVVLMAYDQHGPWENAPGPVGALHWQSDGLRVMRKVVPARKIDLGQAGYGYAWRPHSNDMLSDVQARKLVAKTHATPHWSTAAGEWTARLPDGSTLWWADARSYELRVNIVENLHLHGLAVWDLGLSDPIR